MAYPLGTPWSGSSPSTAYSGTFIPEVWSGKLVEKFYAATVLAAIANTDYEGEIANKGDKVIIRTRPTITIAEYEANQDLSIQRPSSNVVELLIDKGKYFNLALDDVMKIQSDIDQLNIWSEDASEQMKIAVDTDVLGALSTTTDINSANRGLTAGAISGDLDVGEFGVPQFVSGRGDGDFSGSSAANAERIVDYIVKLGQVLDEQNIPESGRWIVVPAWFAARIKKSELRDASLSGDSTSMLRNGRLGMIDRFTIYMSNLLLEVDGYADEWPVLFGTDAALTFAAQFTNMETLRSERSFSTLLRGLQVYGYKVVNGVAIGRGVVSKGDEG